MNPQTETLAHLLADELLEMDDQGAIELEMWPTAQAFIAALEQEAKR